MLRLAPLLLFAACTTAADDPPLEVDAYFTGIPSQYATTDECLAHSTHPYGWDCSFELALCHTGQAGLRTGDVVQLGDYGVDHTGIVRGTIGMSDFKFDLPNAAEIDGSLEGGLTWHPDREGRWMTFSFDVISCD